MKQVFLNYFKGVENHFLEMKYEYKVIIIESLVLLVLFLCIFVAWSRFQKVIKQLSFKPEKSIKDRDL